MDVKVHVLGIAGDRRIEEGEEASAMLHGIVELDGHKIEEVGRVEVLLGGGDILTVKLHLTPGSFEVVTHNDVTWPALLASLASDAQARDGAGRLVAIKPETAPG